MGLEYIFEKILFSCTYIYFKLMAQIQFFVSRQKFVKPIDSRLTIKR